MCIALLEMVTFPPKLRFAFLAVGVWISFLVFGFMQEFLTRNEYGPEKEKFTHTQALVASQALSNVIFASLAIAMEGSSTVRGRKISKWTAGVPSKDWLIVAGSYFLAHSFGLAALKFIIYPLQVVIKSCKAIPVMFGEIIFAKVQPSFAKTVGVVLLSAGVGLFTLSSSEWGDIPSWSSWSEKGSFVAYGASLAGAALLCDAVYGPYQNKIVAKYKASSWVLMLNMNLFEFLIAVSVDLGSSSTHLQQFWVFLGKHPVEFGYRVLLFCISMSVGNVFIYKIQHEFGALSVTKTTTVRKLVSLIVSIWWFGHTLDYLQYLAIALVFSAPLIEHRVQIWEQSVQMRKSRN